MNPSVLSSAPILNSKVADETQIEQEFEVAPDVEMNQATNQRNKPSVLSLNYNSNLM